MSYPWQSLSPKDPFVVRQNSLVSDVHRKIVTFLYQPIIGSTAYSLYMTLLTEVDPEKHWSPGLLHSELLALLNIGIPEFYQARVRLEGIGLLKTYLLHEPGKQYIYEVQSPLSSFDFFHDDLMSLLLYEKVGERKYLSLQERFSSQKVDKGKAEEITKSFLDVYSFSERSFTERSGLKQRAGDLIENDNRTAPAIDGRTFDFTFFHQLLNKQFVSQDSITKELEHTITVLHTLYGCDEMQMSQFVLQAADIETGKVDGQALQKIVSSAYEQKFQTRLQVKDKVAETIEDARGKADVRVKDLQQSHYSKNEIALIQASEQLPPHFFLKSIKKQKGGIVTSGEKQILNDLMQQAAITPAVLNILVHYVLVIQNRPNLAKNFVDSIASDWLQAGVNTPEQALAKAKQFAGEIKAKAEKRATNRTIAKNYGNPVIRKKETLPDWAQADSKIHLETPLSEEAQKKINERIKKLRSSGKAGDE
ncbi:replication initiation and membrane attachment [Trichococcus palustris]|uniref:Replication initiation and membrane attachment n=1 Tax=Trichococcus palustris TaxID=140314 RepID=A0A143YJV1_9LACT|nr:DnaD domain protein [Trichococcus palustris]CZQ91725.1 replication initiation and membrane attachment [Trichococcus palustris]SFL04121.1 replicative DNA helicase loader DnaB [Trichococcus palustris]